MIKYTLTSLSSKVDREYNNIPTTVKNVKMVSKFFKEALKKEILQRQTVVE